MSATYDCIVIGLGGMGSAAAAHLARRGHRQVSFGAGFSGHGFKFCSVIGEIMADLAMEGTPRHPIGFLDLRRFAAPR